MVDELDEQMCEALAGRPGDSTRPERAVDIDVPTLPEVEAANLFLSRIDDAGTVFRYHQLFADLLRDQLRSRDPARASAINTVSRP